MKKILAFSILTLLFFNNSQAEDLIGRVVPPLPDGLTTNNSACVSSALGYDKTCDFVVTNLLYEGKEPHAILVEKQIGRNGKKAFFEITDQINHPKNNKYEYLSIGNCRINGKMDHSILAIVQYTNTEVHKNVKWAAKVNFETGKLSEIPTNDIECINESWGI